MEKLNTFGLEAKGISVHYGHEGEPLRQANLYYNNKLVGIVGDGDWGGPSQLVFNKTDKKVRKEVEEALQKIADQHVGFLKGHFDMSIHELLMLKDWETALRKMNKTRPSIQVDFLDNQGMTLDAYIFFAPHMVALSEIEKEFKEDYDKSKWVSIVSLDENNKAQKVVHQLK